MTDAAPLFINRELSWLEFNRRVLHEAADPRTPLLERVNFLGIFTSNLDEFFMKRVGGLKRQLHAGVSSTRQEDQSPDLQLQDIRKAVLPMIQEQSDLLTREIRPALASEGIALLQWDELADAERRSVSEFFQRNVYPVLTPLTVDQGHPFPFISNLSISLGLLMRHPGRDDEEIFARVKVPAVFPSWIRANPGSEEATARYVGLHEVIGQNLGSLFPGMEIIDVMLFRITRNADIERDEEDADDLLEMIAEELRERRFADVVRLEHAPNPSPRILRLLMEEMEIAEDDVYELPAFTEYFSLGSIAQLSRPALKYEPWAPVVPAALLDQDRNIFDLIRGSDLLVHHPYESFTASVERFVRTAVEDPKVIAIKMTLYRTGEDSPFIPLLIRAAERGKQVVCLVELKARFDEARNILVAQALEEAGVHVVYGIVGLKTHCKLALVVRQEGEGVRCYAHIGTGNYHARTSLVYTDFGLFTAKPEFTEDVVQLFHYLTGRSLHWIFRKLLVAPIDMKPTFLRMIDREADLARAGKPGRIIAKMNSLEDPDTCEALYHASGAGVRIDLIVRGVCCLRPGVPGMSENIRVVSVIGRFLEHSRVFCFGAGATSPMEGEFFIGSADWMHRNLASRVEAVTPVEDRSLKAKLHETLTMILEDRRQAWDMRADGSYVQRQPSGDAEKIGVHERLMRITRVRESPQ